MIDEPRAGHYPRLEFSVNGVGLRWRTKLRKLKKGARKVESSARRMRHSGTSESNGNNVSDGPQKINGRFIAHKWLKLGILPVPLVPRGKNPQAGEGWTTLRVTEETIAQYFRKDNNVGGLWGEVSEWVIDIDLDMPESVAAARVLFPPTFCYGRKGNPRSHYLFRVQHAKTLKFALKDLGTIVEIRANGSQSVLPGSIHPTGELYEVYEDKPFKVVSRATLEQQTRMIAAAAVLGYYYDEGSRHDYVHAITGALCRAKWTEEQLFRFMDAIFAAAGSKETDKEQRIRTIKNTIKHFMRGDNVAGWPTLSQFMPGGHLARVKEWLRFNIHEQSEVPDYVDLPVDGNVPKLPPNLLNVPGLVGDLAKWASKTSFTKQPLFDLCVGLMTVSFCSRNRYVVGGNWDTPLQPYFLCLAPTAAGKDSARNAIFNCVKRNGLGDVVFQGFQSYHAMLDLLAQKRMSLWMWDEAARKLQSASRSQGGADYQVLTYLLELYGKASGSVPGLPGRKQAVPPLDHPFFCVFAAAQPTQLMEAITESDVSFGLINRFILLDAGDRMAEPNENRDGTFPSRIEKALKNLAIVNPPRKDGDFVRIQFENWNAALAFEDFAYMCREKSAQGGGFEMWGRSNQNALICAGIVAVGLDPMRPIITESIAQWAIQFISWCSDRWTYRVEQSASRTLVERGSKLVERIIWGVKSLRHRAQGRPMELELIDRGVLPRSFLTRLTRHLRGRELDDVLTNLIQADIIASGDVNGQTCYWAKQLKDG